VSDVPHWQIAVEVEDAGMRLDRIVVKECPELSRTRVQELIEEGLVRLNGKSAKDSQKVHAGDVIEVVAQPRPPLQAEAESISLEILYEDDDVMAINKPAGMMVHAGAGNSRGTLVNALLGRGEALSQADDPLRQGLLEDERGRIELPIARDPNRRNRMTAKDAGLLPNSRAARTDWRVLARIDSTTLVEVQLHSGRTHQIRVHFSALKHPVVGDTLYGASGQLHVGSATLPTLGRNFLHAAKIAFEQPRTGQILRLAAPLPAELHSYLQKLASAAGDDPAGIDARLAGFL
jgi:23S rRNA pseudouridine1911/1915/1917 synthase